MSESADRAACPHGHDDTVKLLSTVAIATGRSGTGGDVSEAPAGASGCCGGSCGCG